MRFRNYMPAAVLTAVFAIHSVFSVQAAPPPHLYFGTERLYGETYTHLEELYQGTHSLRSDGGDGYADLGAQYAVLPKGDAVMIEKGASSLDLDRQTAFLCWVVIPREDDNTRDPDEYSGYTVLPDGRVAATYKATQYTLDAAYTEPLEYQKAYPACPDALLPYAAEDPLIWLLVYVPELDAKWSVLYRLTKDWESPFYTISIPDSTPDGTWLCDRRGWWIQYEDGSYLTDSWYRDPEDGIWYYMGEDGYMVAGGWVQSRVTGLWYYFDENGQLLTDAMTPDGCYVDRDGIWVW